MTAVNFPTVMYRPPVSVLGTIIRIRNTILRYGWMQGKSGDVHRGFCIGAAMRYAFIGPEYDVPLTAEASALLQETFGVLDEAAGRRCGKSCVVFYNDEVLKSKQQALVFLNEVIAELRENLAEAAT